MKIRYYNVAVVFLIVSLIDILSHSFCEENILFLVISIISISIHIIQKQNATKRNYKFKRK